MVTNNELKSVKVNLDLFVKVSNARLASWSFSERANVAVQLLIIIINFIVLKNYLFAERAL